MYLANIIFKENAIITATHKMNTST